MAVARIIGLRRWFADSIMLEVQNHEKEKIPSLKKQVIDRLMAMASYGQSKYADKQRNGGKPARGKVYSYQTMRNYQYAAVGFTRWAKGQGCRTLEDARPLTGQYLQKRMDEGKSAWTIRLDAAALAKVYQVKMSELGVKLSSRRRENITQHRTKAWRGHFSEERNRDLVELCRATGLRRCELAKLRPEDVQCGPDGVVRIHVPRGKGGRERYLVTLSDAPWRLAEAARAEGLAYVVE